MKSQEKQAPPALVIKRIIPARRSDVFDAWTKPELMRQWFRPTRKWGSECAIDLRVGGHWSNNMIDDGSGKHNGTKSPAGTCSRHEGDYLEIKPPERLVFTWDTPYVQNTRVTVELRDLGDKTELTLTHELLATEEQRKGHSEGWNICLDHLVEDLSK